MSKGKVLITGASSGIGAEFVRQFAERDFELVIVARRRELLDRLASEVNTPCQVIACDLSTEAGISQLFNDTADQHISILINNAGIASKGFFNNQSRDSQQRVIDLNVSALTRLTHHYLPAMVKQGAGRILNVASVAAFQPVPGLAQYAASKAYVLSLTESLSEELRGTGVSVTALCPGMTKTDLLDEIQGFDVPSQMTTSPENVAREGIEALMAGEVIRIPGIANQAAVTWAKHQPRWVVRGLGGLLARLNPRS